MKLIHVPISEEAYDALKLQGIANDCSVVKMATAILERDCAKYREAVLSAIQHIANIEAEYDKKEV